MFTAHPIADIVKTETKYCSYVPLERSVIYLPLKINSKFDLRKRSHSFASLKDFVFGS